MKIFYVSNQITSGAFKSLFDFGEKTPGQQVQKFNRLLSEGLSENDNDVINVSVPPVTPGNCKKLFPKLNDEKNFHYINVINLPVIKNIITGIKTRAFIMKNAQPGDAVVADLLCASGSRGALRAARKKNVATVGIVTDLPKYLPGRAGSAPFIKLFKKNAELCSGYVLMTMAMHEELPKDKTFIVIEGMAEDPLTEKAVSKGDYCLYAGGLEEAYGVRDMVTAFINIHEKHPETTLRIYGNGTLREWISEKSNEYPFIEYLGQKPNETVVMDEINARLLINPRPASGDFTAFSFPSKNLEYLATGTPVLCYMLPGMPEVYKSYILEIGDSLEKSLDNALSNDNSQMGQKARAFVLDRKNKKAQAKNLDAMIKAIN